MNRSEISYNSIDKIVFKEEQVKNDNKLSYEKYLEEKYRSSDEEDLAEQKTINMID